MRPDIVVLGCLRAGRALVAATLTTHHPVEAAAVAEVASATLPLLTSRGVGVLMALAIAPSFASTILPRLYVPIDAAAARSESVGLAIFLLLLSHASAIPW